VNEQDPRLWLMLLCLAALCLAGAVVAAAGAYDRRPHA
jgi:hypothetical protein